MVPNVLVLFVLCTWLSVICGFHISIVPKNYATVKERKIHTAEIHDELKHHEKVFLFGNASYRPDVKFFHVIQNDFPHHHRGKRSPNGLMSVQLEDGDVGKQVNLKLQQSTSLVDDAFILIRRFENSSQFIENSHKLASEYEKCFYRNENSALDLCDNAIRGIFNHNSTDFFIHPLPSRFGQENPHIVFKKSENEYQQQQKQQQLRYLDRRKDLRQVNDIVFEPELDDFNDIKKLSEQKLLFDVDVDDNDDDDDGRSRLLDNKEETIANNEKSHKNYSTKANKKNELTRNDGDLRRIKRHISSQWKTPQVLHIETAIFVDKDLFKHMARNFPKNTESHLIRFVLAMINGVQLLYHHPSLGHQINFVLKRLEILHSDPKELRRSSDIDIFLNNFCMWQRKLNPAADTDVVHYDHAVILTGLDLYVVGKNGKVSSQVVGLAPVAGMCTSTSSCTINEGKHFESVFVVAHEIGHNLGMRHDTSENSCDPSLYIMSPTLGSGKTTWSKCSRTYLNSFLESTQAQCMFDRGKFGNSLDHSAEGILPGERFDADQQCMLKYGTDSIRSRSQPMADICRDLHCQRDRYTWTSHPALEGTECGEMMWCRSGICIMKATLMESYSIPKQITHPKQFDKANFVEDKKLGNLRHEYNFNKAPTWGEWGEPGDCDSGCLYGSSGRLREGSTGLRISMRSCLDHRKRCAGRDRRYEACSAKPCYSIEITTIEEFATQICERAKKFDTDLSGEGTQIISDSVEDSCKVFCQTRTNSTKSRSWTFPDGTTCRARTYDFDDTSYCINGRCERFSCENSSHNYFKIDPTFCPQNLVKEETKQVNTIYQENGRDYKSVRLRSYNKVENVEFAGNNFQSPRSIIRKSDTFRPWRYTASDRTPKFDSIWTPKTGCHFSCMDKARGIQVISSKLDNTNNVQLCTPKLIPCDKLQTSNEFAENLCSRYKLKVRGLSGYGMQIAPSVQDPDRSCRVACQDEILPHRFYLVNSDHGLFPFGTKCAPEDERYCINGKCLEFGPDNIPLTQSYISLALFRNKRDISSTLVNGRSKRSYLYYKPVNITEYITQQYLDKVARSIDFSMRVLGQPISNEHIEFMNPIQIEELIIV